MVCLTAITCLFCYLQQISRSRGFGWQPLDFIAAPSPAVVSDPLCGLASDGGMTANQSLAAVPDQTVGAGLPAMTASQPTNLSRLYPIKL
ncbi:hypothetical protein EMIT0P218_30308 [Pseudomonas sp. IT-P218]